MNEHAAAFGVPGRPSRSEEFTGSTLALDALDAQLLRVVGPRADLAIVATPSRRLVVRFADSERLTAWRHDRRRRGIPRLAQNGDRIDLIIPEAWGDAGRLDIELPRQMGLRVDTLGGRVEVEGLRGKVDVDLATGDVTLRDCLGGFDLDLAGGDVRIEHCAGRGIVDLARGEVWVRRHRGDLTVDVTTDLVHIEGWGDGRLSVDSVGPVWLAPLLFPSDRVDVDTVGQVTLAVARDAAFSLRVSAGDFESSLPLEVEEDEDGELRGVRLRADARVTVDAGRGSVRLVEWQPAERHEEPDAWAPSRAVGEASTWSDDARETPGDPPREGGAAALEAEVKSVLEMVAEGRITPEEADRLIEALSRPAAGSSATAGVEHDLETVERAPDGARASLGAKPARASEAPLPLEPQPASDAPPAPQTPLAPEAPPTPPSEEEGVDRDGR